MIIKSFKILGVTLQFLNIMLERIQKRAMNIIYGYDVSYSEALVMSKLHKLFDHRSYLCDDFFKKIILNPKDKIYGLLPNDISVTSSLKNRRNFTIPIERTVLKILSSLQPLGGMTIVVFSILSCNFYLVI